MLCLQYFSQHIIGGRLLLVVTGGQNSKLSYEFKLESITNYHLYIYFFEKYLLSIICCESIVKMFCT